MSDWKNYLILTETDEIRETRREHGKHIGQEEVSYYEIVNNGVVTGTIKYSVHTSPNRPFRESFTLKQYDIERILIVDKKW